MSTGARAMATAEVLVADGRRVPIKAGGWQWERDAIPKSWDRPGQLEHLRQCGIVHDFRPDLKADVIANDLALDAAFKLAEVSVHEKSRLWGLRPCRTWASFRTSAERNLLHKSGSAFMAPRLKECGVGTGCSKFPNSGNLSGGGTGPFPGSGEHQQRILECGGRLSGITTSGNNGNRINECGIVPKILGTRRPAIANPCNCRDVSGGKNLPPILRSGSRADFSAPLEVVADGALTGPGHQRSPRYLDAVGYHYRHRRRSCTLCHLLCTRMCMLCTRTCMLRYARTWNTPNSPDLVN
jgi:hypothetical protein